MAYILTLVVLYAISFRFIWRLWRLRGDDSVAYRMLWTCILLIPVFGWVCYGGFYSPPGTQPQDLRARRTRSVPGGR